MKYFFFCILFFLVPVTKAEKKYRHWESNAKIRLAIKKGLKFISSTQLKDGSWTYIRGSTSGWHDGQGSYQMTLTAVSATAFLSAGHTTERGQYCNTVKKALQFILRQTKSKVFKSKGLLTTPNEGLNMYGHGYATLFLTQIYGTSSDPKLNRKIRSTIRRAIQLIVNSQSRAGGWYYTPDASQDEGSVTITQVQALRAAQNVGIAVNKRTIDRALAYLKLCQNLDGGIRYDSRPGQPSSPALSSAGLACYYNCGKYDGKNVEMLKKYLKKKFQYNQKKAKLKLTFNLHIMGSNHDMYTNHYASQAIFFIGGDFWKSYFTVLSEKLIREQDRKGAWKTIPNPTFATSMAIMMLTLPYRYLPINQR